MIEVIDFIDVIKVAKVINVANFIYRFVAEATFTKLKIVLDGKSEREMKIRKNDWMT